MGKPVGEQLPEDLVDRIKLGELGHVVVQGVGRGASRGCDGPSCRPCTVYIIAAKRHGLPDALRVWFPGCRVEAWRSRHKPLKGRVADAVAFMTARLKKDPDAPIPFSDIMECIEEPNRSNFNRTIRKHPQFLTALEDLGIEEVRVHGSRHFDAFQRAVPLFDADPEATFFAGDLGSHI